MTGASVIFFFNDTATTEIYTLSLHDALPIGPAAGPRGTAHRPDPPRAAPARPHPGRRPGHRGQTRHLHRVRPRGTAGDVVSAHVRADRDVCIGAGNCVMTLAAVFDQDDEGLRS